VLFALQIAARGGDTREGEASSEVHWPARGFNRCYLSAVDGPEHWGRTTETVQNDGFRCGPTYGDDKLLSRLGRRRKKESWSGEGSKRGRAREKTARCVPEEAETMQYASSLRGLMRRDKSVETGKKLRRESRGQKRRQINRRKEEARMCKF